MTKEEKEVRELKKIIDVMTKEELSFALLQMAEVFIDYRPTHHIIKGTK